MDKKLKKEISGVIEAYLVNTTEAEHIEILKNRELPLSLIEDINQFLVEKRDEKIAEKAQELLKMQKAEDLNEWNDCDKELENLDKSLKEVTVQLQSAKNRLQKCDKGFLKDTPPTKSFLNEKWSNVNTSFVIEAQNERNLLMSEIYDLDESFRETIRNQLNLTIDKPFTDLKPVWEKIWIKMYWAKEYTVAAKQVNEFSAIALSKGERLQHLHILQQRCKTDYTDVKFSLSTKYQEAYSEIVEEIGSVYDLKTFYPDTSVLFKELLQKLHKHAEPDSALSKALDNYDSETKARKNFETDKSELLVRVGLLKQSITKNITNVQHINQIDLIENQLSTTSFENNELDAIRSAVDRWCVVHQHIVRFTEVKTKISAAIDRQLGELVTDKKENLRVRLLGLDKQIELMVIDGETNQNSFADVIKNWVKAPTDGKSNAQAFENRGGFFCTPRKSYMGFIAEYERIIASDGVENEARAAVTL